MSGLQSLREAYKFDKWDLFFLGTTKSTSAKGLLSCTWLIKVPRLKAGSRMSIKMKPTHSDISNACGRRQTNERTESI